MVDSIAAGATHPPTSSEAPKHAAPVGAIGPARPGARARFVWAIASVFVVESVIVGLAALPAVVFWRAHLRWAMPVEWVRIVVLAMSLIPAYLVFAVGLMVLSAGITRVLGWRTPVDAQMRIRDFDWPLLNWGRYLISIHLVRVLAGTILKATPLWSFYLRINGATIGRGVYVNSLALNDHNLIEMGDHVVIGDACHISGHTVEHGYVKTGRVRLGDNVTIGLESVIGIDVHVGRNTQVGALSLVPKRSRLEPGAVYVGIPVALAKWRENRDESSRG